MILFPGMIDYLMTCDLYIVRWSRKEKRESSIQKETEESGTHPKNRRDADESFKRKGWIRLMEKYRIRICCSDMCCCFVRMRSSLLTTYWSRAFLTWISGMAGLRDIYRSAGPGRIRTGTWGVGPEQVHPVIRVPEENRIGSGRNGKYLCGNVARQRSQDQLRHFFALPCEPGFQG